ncbi:hypothetical protein MMC13_000785 [Lambiella insularis]|nr:hypothetical protein [Lambiella insularis]
MATGHFLPFRQYANGHFPETIVERLHTRILTGRALKYEDLQEIFRAIQGFLQTNWGNPRFVYTSVYRAFVIIASRARQLAREDGTELLYQYWGWPSKLSRRDAKDGFMDEDTLDSAFEDIWYYLQILRDSGFRS